MYFYWFVERKTNVQTIITMTVTIIHSRNVCIWTIILRKSDEATTMTLCTWNHTVSYENLMNANIISKQQSVTNTKHINCSSSFGNRFFNSRLPNNVDLNEFFRIRKKMAIFIFVVVFDVIIFFIPVVDAQLNCER